MARTQIIYMLHYAEPIGDPSHPKKWARHYVGSYWSDNRIASHRNGTSGVRIVAAFHRAGIPFTVVLTRPGDKMLERRLKTIGHFPRYCPVCSPRPWRGLWHETEENHGEG